jgi:hypothetical protein
MSPPTHASTLAPPFATATATAVDRVDRGAPTHSLILEGPRLFRPRADPMSALSSAPTYAPTTSPPALDTVVDDEPIAAAPESGVGRSVAPQVRSLAAAPLSRLPWGAIAASAVGVAGLVVLAIVAFSLHPAPSAGERPGPSAVETPLPSGLGAEPPRDRPPEARPVVSIPAPILQPDSLDGVAEPPLHQLPLRVEAPSAEPPPPLEPSSAPSAKPLPPKAGGGELKPRSRSNATGGSSAAAPPPRSSSGVTRSQDLHERPGPGF